MRLKKGDSIDIPVGAIHRMENQTESKVVFVEIHEGRAISVKTILNGWKMISAGNKGVNF